MALVALDCSVRAQKRETVLVILHLLDGNVPTLHGVALRAVWTVLPAVNVGVATRTILADIGKDGLAMALNASHLFMHAAQGVAGFAVVEFRIGLDGAPASGGVAVFAGDF
jgi:hypothetical protein